MLIITLFLVLAATVGVVYAYMQRETAPYAPGIHEYLDKPHEADNETARAA